MHARQIRLLPLCFHIQRSVLLLVSFLILITSASLQNLLKPAVFKPLLTLHYHHHVPLTNHSSCNPLLSLSIQRHLRRIFHQHRTVVASGSSRQADILYYQQEDWPLPSDIGIAHMPLWCGVLHHLTPSVTFVTRTCQYTSSSRCDNYLWLSGRKIHDQAILICWYWIILYNWYRAKHESSCFVLHFWLCAPLQGTSQAPQSFKSAGVRLLDRCTMC